MSALLWTIIFTVSLAVLIKSSDLFIISAEKVGTYFKLPPFMIGVLIIGFGTSLPELVSALVSVTTGASEIVIGNVLGSNITNIFLVVGIAGFIGKEFKVDYDVMKSDFPFLVASMFLLAFMVWDQEFTRGEGILCLVGFVYYLYYTLRNPEQMHEILELEEHPVRPRLRHWITLLLAPAGIYFGAHYTIDSVVIISERLKIATEVIALSAVALGTSLPELMVTISAARKGKPELTIGNVLGSNIFNTLMVMGVPAMIGTLRIPDSIITFSLPLSLAATLIYIVIVLDHKINRLEGGILLVFYAFFILRIFGFA
ncbi:MAG: calcium/sodium antiporter [Spirochaetota bacterium]